MANDVTISENTLNYLRKCFMLTLSFFMDNPTDFLPDNTEPEHSELEIVKQLEEFEYIGGEIGIDIWEQTQGSTNYAKYREIYLKHQ